MKVKLQWAGIAFGGIGFLDLLVLSLAASGMISLALSVASVGVITFLGVLWVASYLSEESALKANEVRDAIAASFVAVYLTTVGWVTFGGVSPGDPALLGHFSNLVGVLIGFYVGAKVAEVAIMKYKEMRVEIARLGTQ